MPGLFKHTLIIEGAGKGWTETLYLERDTDDPKQVLDSVDSMKVKRAALLAKQFYVKAERMALVKDAAGVKVTRKSALKKGFWPGNQAEAGEDTTTSLQVLWIAPNGRDKKITFLGGPWAGIFPFADAYEPKYSTWATKLGDWANYIKANRYGWLHQTEAGKETIIGYTFDPLTGITEYTLKGAGMNWPALSEVYRVAVEFPTKRHSLDGVQLVVPDPATKAKTVRPAPAFPFTLQGTMRRYTYEFLPMGNANPQGNTGSIEGTNPVGRKRGRPLLERRGRAPALVRM
jgi:hypothetical protein